MGALRYCEACGKWSDNVYQPPILRCITLAWNDLGYDTQDKIAGLAPLTTIRYVWTTWIFVKPLTHTANVETAFTRIRHFYRITLIKVHAICGKKFSAKNYSLSLRFDGKEG